MHDSMAFLGFHTTTVFVEKAQVTKGQTRLMKAFIMFPALFLIPVMKQQPTLPWAEAGNLDIFSQLHSKVHCSTKKKQYLWQEKKPN